MDPAKRADLALRRLEPVTLLRRRTGPATSISFRRPNAAAGGLAPDAAPRGDRPDRHPLRPVRLAVLAHHPNRSLAQLARERRHRPPRLHDLGPQGSRPRRTRGACECPLLGERDLRWFGGAFDRPCVRPPGCGRPDATGGRCHGGPAGPGRSRARRAAPPASPSIARPSRVAMTRSCPRGSPPRGPALPPPRLGPCATGPAGRRLALPPFPATRRTAPAAPTRSRRVPGRPIAPTAPSRAAPPADRRRGTRPSRAPAVAPLKIRCEGGWGARGHRADPRHRAQPARPHAPIAAQDGGFGGRPGRSEGWRRRGDPAAPEDNRRRRSTAVRDASHPSGPSPSTTGRCRPSPRCRGPTGRSWTLAVAERRASRRRPSPPSPRADGGPGGVAPPGLEEKDAGVRPAAADVLFPPRARPHGRGIDRSPSMGIAAPVANAVRPHTTGVAAEPTSRGRPRRAAGASPPSMRAVRRPSCRRSSRSRGRRGGARGRRCHATRDPGRKGWPSAPRGPWRRSPRRARPRPSQRSPRSRRSSRGRCPRGGRASGARPPEREGTHREGSPPGRRRGRDPGRRPASAPARPRSGRRRRAVPPPVRPGRGGSRPRRAPAGRGRSSARPPGSRWERGAAPISAQMEGTGRPRSGGA